VVMERRMSNSSSAGFAGPFEAGIVEGWRANGGGDGDLEVVMVLRTRRDDADGKGKRRDTTWGGCAFLPGRAAVFSMGSSRPSKCSGRQRNISLGGSDGLSGGPPSSLACNRYSGGISSFLHKPNAQMN